MIAPFMPYVLAAAVAVGALGSLWAYKEGKAVGAEGVRAAQLSDTLLRITTRDEVLKVVAQGLQNIEVKNETVVRNFKTIEREVPVYRECAHPEPAVRLLNDALRGDTVRAEPAVPSIMP